MHVSVCVCRQYINTPSPLLDFLCFSLARNYPECTSPNGRTLLSNPTCLFSIPTTTRQPVNKIPERDLSSGGQAAQEGTKTTTTIRLMSKVYINTRTHTPTQQSQTQNLSSLLPISCSQQPPVFTLTHTQTDHTLSHTKKHTHTTTAVGVRGGDDTPLYYGTRIIRRARQPGGLSDGQQRIRLCDTRRVCDFD